MASKDPKALHSLLQDEGDSSLRKIVRQAHRLAAINQLLACYLPANLTPHCYAAQITPTALTLITDSAAWMTHLRYLKPQLLQQLKQHPQCTYLQDIHFRLQPHRLVTENTSPSPILPPRKLSADNKELLLSTAEMVSDLELKKALRKLCGVTS